jgi:arylsulfatase A-like enzyme
MYDQIVERGLLDDTLIVFTSDHGQALGEWSNGGRFGHGHPMCPENLETPIVFIGAGLPEGEEYPALLSGTDIAPTVLSAQRGTVPADADGTDVWRDVPDPDRKLRADVWQHLDVEAFGRSIGLSVYAATSAWDDGGGYVFHRKSRAQRLAGLAYDNLFRGYSPAWRSNLSAGKAANFLTLSLASDLSFGAPEFSEAEAERWLPTEFTERTAEDGEPGLSDDQQEQLRDLGYLQ